MPVDYGSLANTFLQSSRATEQTDMYRARALAKDEKSKAIGQMHMGIAAAAQSVKETSLSAAQNTSMWGQKMVEYAQRNMEFQAVQANQQKALAQEDEKIALMKADDQRASALHDFKMKAAQRQEDSLAFMDRLNQQTAAEKIQGRHALGKLLGLRSQPSEMGLKMLDVATKLSTSESPIFGALGRVLSDVLMESQEGVPAEALTGKLGLSKAQIQGLRMSYYANPDDTADLLKSYQLQNAQGQAEGAAMGMQSLFALLNPSVFNEEETQAYIARGSQLWAAGEAGVREFSTGLIPEVQKEARARLAAKGYMTDRTGALLLDDAEIAEWWAGDSAARTKLIEIAEKRRAETSALIAGLQPFVDSVDGELQVRWNNPGDSRPVIGTPMVTDDEALKNAKGTDWMSLLSNPSQKGGYLTPVGVNLRNENRQAILWVRSNRPINDQSAALISGEFTKNRATMPGSTGHLGVKQFGGTGEVTGLGGQEDVSYYVIGGSVAPVPQPGQSNSLEHVFGMLPSDKNTMAAPWSMIGETVTGKKMDIGAVELTRFARVAQAFEEDGYSKEQIFQDLQDGRYEKLETAEEAGTSAAVAASSGPTYLDPSETAMERFDGMLQTSFGFQEGGEPGPIIMAATVSPNLYGLRSTPEILGRRSEQASAAARTIMGKVVTAPGGYFDLALEKWSNGDVAGGNAEIERAVTLLAGSTLFTLSGQAEYGQEEGAVQQMLSGNPGPLTASSFESIVMAESNAMDPGTKAIYRELRSEIHRTVVAPALESFYRAARPVKALMGKDETEEEYLADFDKWEGLGGMVKTALRGGAQVGAGLEKVYVPNGTRSPAANAALGTLSSAALKSSPISTYGIGAEQLAMLDPQKVADVQADFLTKFQNEFSVGRPNLDKLLRGLGLKAPKEVKEDLEAFLHNSFLGDAPRSLWVPMGDGWVPVDARLAQDFWNSQLEGRERISGQEATTRMREFTQGFFPEGVDPVKNFSSTQLQTTWEMVRNLSNHLGGKEPSQVATWLRSAADRYVDPPGPKEDIWYVGNTKIRGFSDSTDLKSLMALLPSSAKHRITQSYTGKSVSSNSSFGTGPGRMSGETTGAKKNGDRYVEEVAIQEFYRSGFGEAFAMLAPAGVLRRHRSLIDSLEQARRRAEAVESGPTVSRTSMEGTVVFDSAKNDRARRRRYIEGAFKYK